MGNLPLPAPSGAGVLSLVIAPPSSDAAQFPASEPLGDIALLGVLREAAMAGSLSADVILNAVTDAARVLSSADGTAIASRENGVMVCRARSGSVAPDLGAPVNADSGISGQCLRTASIQICSDATTDDRVDSEVCRALGICSVAVVPLRGRMGMFGILEAFSSRTSAFEQEQIDSLRSLAEIAEIAYERERSAATPAPAPSPVRAALFPVARRGDRNDSRARFLRKHSLWVAGVLVALLAMAWIASISWRQTGVEIAASTSAVQKASAATPSPKIERATSQKPEAAVFVYPPDRARSRVVEKSSIADRVPEAAIVLTPSKNPSIAESTRNPKLTGDDSPVSAPPVAATVSSIPGEVPGFAPETAPLPRLGVVASRGTDAPAIVLERVNPIYPPVALSHGIGGDVILDATVSQKGSIRQIKVVSGAASLIDAAVVAVRQWRFSPALLNGKPIEVQQRITVSFKMQ